MDDRLGLDYARIFAASPMPCLVLSPDLVILDATTAYLRATGRQRDDLVGKPMFTAFPDNPDDPSANGVANLRASLERVRDTGRPDTMAVQKYDIPDAARGGFLERYWLPVNVPVLDDGGTVRWLLHRVEDVTEFLAERRRGAADRQRGEQWRQQGETWRRRMEQAEADLIISSQELLASRGAEAVTAGMLTALSDVALALADADTVEELTDVVIGRGMAVFGCDGGAVAIRTEGCDVLRLTFTEGLGDPAHLAPYARLPLDGPLPASVAARGELMLVRDADTTARVPGLSQASAVTGCQAWAGIPLEAGGRLLGSLVAGWRTPQVFAPAEVELLTVFAAQCAQALDRIRRRDAEQQAAAVQRRIAETLQRSMLTEPPEPDHLQIAVRYLPATQEAQVGGDWYDAFLTSDGATTVVVGDVTGHDRIAAAAMGQVRNLLRGIAQAVGEPPAAVLSTLDRALRTLGVQTLATAVLAQIEQSPEAARRGQRVLRWSNAGHPPPLLIQPDGQPSVLQRPSDLLLGLDPAAARHDHEVVLKPGATVVLYTDGLVERRDQTLEQGLQRLQSLVAEVGSLPLEQLCDTLLDRLADHAEDDVALLVVRAHPQDRPRPPEAGPRRRPATIG